MSSDNDSLSGNEVEVQSGHESGQESVNNVEEDNNETQVEQNQEHQQDENKDGGNETKKKEVKPKRKLLLPKFDTQTIKNAKGLPAIKGHFKDVKFKGRGHEEHDLNVLMKTYEYWCHRFYPKFTFDDAIERLEWLGNKKATQVYLRKIRMGLEDIIEDDKKIESDDEIGTGGFVEPYDDRFDQLLPAAVDKPEPEPTEEQLEIIKQNRLRAEAIRRARMSGVDSISTQVSSIPSQIEDEVVEPQKDDDRDQELGLDNILDIINEDDQDTSIRSSIADIKEKIYEARVANAIRKNVVPSDSEEDELSISQSRQHLKNVLISSEDSEDNSSDHDASKSDESAVLQTSLLSKKRKPNGKITKRSQILSSQKKVVNDSDTDSDVQPSISQKLDAIKNKENGLQNDSKTASSSVSQKAHKKKFIVSESEDELNDTTLSKTPKAKQKKKKVGDHNVKNSDKQLLKKSAKNTKGIVSDKESDKTRDGKSSSDSDVDSFKSSQNTPRYSNKRRLLGEDSNDSDTDSGPKLSQNLEATRSKENVLCSDSTTASSSVSQKAHKKKFVLSESEDELNDTLSKTSKAKQKKKKVGNLNVNNSDKILLKKSAINTKGIISGKESDKTRENKSSSDSDVKLFKSSQNTPRYSKKRRLLSEDSNDSDTDSGPKPSTSQNLEAIRSKENVLYSDSTTADSSVSQKAHKKKFVLSESEDELNNTKTSKTLRAKQKKKEVDASNENYSGKKLLKNSARNKGIIGDDESDNTRQNKNSSDSDVESFKSSQNTTTNSKKKRLLSEDSDDTRNGLTSQLSDTKRKRVQKRKKERAIESDQDTGEISFQNTNKEVHSSDNDLDKIGDLSSQGSSAIKKKNGPSNDIYNSRKNKKKRIILSDDSDDTTDNISTQNVSGKNKKDYLHSENESATKITSKKRTIISDEDSNDTSDRLSSQKSSSQSSSDIRKKHDLSVTTKVISEEDKNTNDLQNSHESGLSQNSQKSKKKRSILSDEDSVDNISTPKKKTYVDDMDISKTQKKTTTGMISDEDSNGVSDNVFSQNLSDVEKNDDLAIEHSSLASSQHSEKYIKTSTVNNESSSDSRSSTSSQNTETKFSSTVQNHSQNSKQSSSEKKIETDKNQTKDSLLEPENMDKAFENIENSIDKMKRPEKTESRDVLTDIKNKEFEQMDT